MGHQVTIFKYLKMVSYSLAVAVHLPTFGIGKNGKLPWKLNADLKYFKRLTSEACNGKKNAVVMGRKTYLSIPPSLRPLSDRINIVLSRGRGEELCSDGSVIVLDSLQAALNFADENTAVIDQVFVIGGESLFRESMKNQLCKKIFFTGVEGEVEGMDTFFPQISSLDFKMTARSAPMTESNLTYRYLEFDRIAEDWIGGNLNSLAELENNTEEMQYLNLIDNILKNGTLRGDRTGTGTLSLFGVQMRFSLRNGVFPLLTTKRVFWRGVAEELLWFLKGSTNANLLSEKGVKIWEDNASRQFLDKCGFVDREEGDLGPVYGFQWRHFGAVYSDMHADYSNCGVDQLMECINQIKNDPNSRRIVMSAWNPTDLPKMALPPCHMFCQFHVANGELNCQMYQRSADMGLGVPFNIASYALLTVLVAQVCGLTPGEFVHTIGDAHIYVNHIEALKEQLTRTPKPFPHLEVNKDIMDIDAFQFSDFTVTGYDPHATIKMKMAV